MKTLPLEIRKISQASDYSGCVHENVHQWAFFLIFSSSIARLDS